MSQTLSLSRVVRPEPGWYRGDFHAHTDQSDGYYSPRQLAGVARSEGLDFFTVTDHNTVDAYTLFGYQPDLLIIPGVEATFNEGHFNMFGIQDWSDWMKVVCTGNKRVKLDGDYRSFTELLKATAGDDLGPVEGAVRFTGKVTAGSPQPASVARLAKNGRMIAEKQLHDVGSKRGETALITEDVVGPAEPAWYRLDVFGNDEQYLAVTNPIFAGPRRPPELCLYSEFLKDSV